MPTHVHSKWLPAQTKPYHERKTHFPLTHLAAAAAAAAAAAPVVGIAAAVAAAAAPAGHPYQLAPPACLRLLWLVHQSRLWAL